MHARQWLALGVGVLGGMLLWVAFAGDKSARASASGPERRPERAADARAPELAMPDTGSATLRSQAPLESAESASEPGSETRQALEAAAAPVIMRVRLALASGEPASFAGWRVEAQSWIEKTNATFPHETEASAAGVAEFRFDDFVHIDWVRCIPPPESGLALAFSEHHANLDPGQTLEATLELEPGGVLTTRVVDLDGQPVAGARVHAFSDDCGSIADWQPGLASATSGPDGRVELPTLPPGEWALAVEPVEWLQVGPYRDDQDCLVPVEAGERSEVEGRIVAPLHPFRLRLLDAAGRGVPDAQVMFRALELGPAGMRARAPKPLEIFLGQALAPEAVGAPLTWPHDELSRITDENGEAALFGVRGTWELEVAQNLVKESPATRIRREIELPSPDVTLRVPTALARLSSRVVDDHGPLAGARVVLRPVERGSAGETEARSAKDGTFELSGVPPGVPFTLALSHVDHLSTQWPIVLAGDQELPDHVLRRGTWVRLRLVDADGAPVRNLRVSTLALLPDEPPPPEETAARGSESRSANARGQVRMGPYPPGKIEVGVLVTKATGIDPVTSAATGFVQVPCQTWIVPVTEEEQTLVFDRSRLPAPTPPRADMLRGVVVDALTGAPIGGANVSLREASRWARTDGEGRFSLQRTPVLGPIAVHAEGHLPLELPEQEWAGGAGELRLAVQPGGHDLALEFVDRLGERLPRASFTLKDPEGHVLVVWVRRDGAVRSMTGGCETDGSVELTSVPPGPLVVELWIEGCPIGKVALESDAGRAPQQATLRLDRSLAEIRLWIERALAEQDEEEAFEEPFSEDEFGDE